MLKAEKVALFILHPSDFILGFSTGRVMTVRQVKQPWLMGH